MVSEQFQSPNAIPPRTSSSGLSTSFLTSPSPVRPQSPTKPVLKPVPEGDWIAQRRKLHTTSASLDLTSSDSFHRSDGVAKHINGREWSPDKEKILLGPFEYMYDHPGKNIRKSLITAFNVWLKVPAESLAIITKVVGMLHTASLLVDDVEDSSLLRRGIPVAHSIFGTAQTINSANYVYFQALQELVKLNNPEVVQIYTEELINLHRGQGMDLFWRDTLTCPNEDDYLEMVGNKTGGLFRLAVKLMQAESDSDKWATSMHASVNKSTNNQRRDYVPLVNLIGALFQIRDDYLNLASNEYTSNKGFCEDLTEGKFSFPIIHSIRTNPSNLQLINIIKQKTTDEEVKRYAVAYMKSTGSFDYCRKTMKELHAKSIAMVDAMDEGKGAGEGVRTILHKMVVD